MAMKKSFGAEVAEIAEELNLPKATVERVLRTRLKHQVAEIKAGNSIAVEGLYSIRVRKTPHGLELRGAVSSALKGVLNGERNELRMLVGD